MIKRGIYTGNIMVTCNNHNGKDKLCDCRYDLGKAVRVAEAMNSKEVKCPMCGYVNGRL